jgi:hypothetical protein
VLLILVVGLVLLGGCTEDHHSGARARTTDSSTPRLGGPRLHARQAPHTAMDRLERPVAQRLARRVAGEGLSLTYLDCPRWDGHMPTHLTCRGYLDGVVGRVEVSLHAPVRGHAVDFEARLAGGVVATRTLEETLREKGLRRPDCGRIPAYPARVGLQVVCRVGPPGFVRYVVARVRDGDGTVLVTAYRG